MSGLSPDSSSSVDWNCVYCEKSYKSEKNLQRHASKCKKQPTMKCEICYAWVRTMDFDSHVARDKKINTKCNRCDEWYSNQALIPHCLETCISKKELTPTETAKYILNLCRQIEQMRTELHENVSCSCRCRYDYWAMLCVREVTLKYRLSKCV